MGGAQALNRADHLARMAANLWYHRAMSEVADRDVSPDGLPAGSTNWAEIVPVEISHRGKGNYIVQRRCDGMHYATFSFLWHAQSFADILNAKLIAGEGI